MARQKRQNKLGLWNSLCTTEPTLLEVIKWVSKVHYAHIQLDDEVTSNITVVKRTRVPAGSLVKMATDADVDSGRITALIQSVAAYTWNILSGKIHGGIRSIQYKTLLRRPFHRCTIAPRKNIFWRGCFVFIFCQCRGYLYFFTRVPCIFTRVPALYESAWFVSHLHYGVFHRTQGAQTRQQTCEQEFCNEILCFMSKQLHYIHLILCEIACTS